MKDICAMYNCEEAPTQGDGNCQFRALSLGLYESEDRHTEVRANIVQHLRENPENASALGGADDITGRNPVSRERV